MRDTPAWREILQRNHWTDSFLAGAEFEVYLAEETAKNAAMLQAMGLVPSTSLFPFVIGLGLLGSFLWIVILHRPQPQLLRGRAWKPMLLLSGLVLAYIVVLETIGYVLATIALVFFTARILDSRRWRRDLLAGAALSITVYVVFEFLLRKGLPAGWLPL
jgi:hypothetical protein